MKKISTISEHPPKIYDLKIKYKEKKAELENVTEDKKLAEHEKIQVLDGYYHKESIKNENMNNELKQKEDKLSEINNKKSLLEKEVEDLKNQLREAELEYILNSPEQEPLEDITEINLLEYSNDENKDNKGYDSYSDGYDGYDDDYDTYNSYDERLLIAKPEPVKIIYQDNSELLLQSMSTTDHKLTFMGEIALSEKNNSKIKSDNILLANNPTIFS
nr:hypothetical protein [uncultured Moellerella sp.]